MAVAELISGLPVLLLGDVARVCDVGLYCRRCLDLRTHGLAVFRQCSASVRFESSKVCLQGNLKTLYSTSRVKPVSATSIPGQSMATVNLQTC